MPLPLKPSFPIRRNANGTYDSICTACLATVATAQHEWELGRHESSHVCEPMNLYRVSHGLLSSPRIAQESSKEGQPTLRMATQNGSATLPRRV
jgi:hypothetical protein